MRKIPTLFERDWDGDRSRVLPGEPKIDLTGAVATRKRDGTACLIRDGKLFKRYDLKAGRTAPPFFESCGEADPKTGHNPGWVPVGNEPESKWHIVAFEARSDRADGTFELCGPKVQGNPESMAVHALLRHGVEQLFDVPTDYPGIAAYLAANAIEGIVWWRDGEPIAKIKRRDFGLQWPVKEAANA